MVGSPRNNNNNNNNNNDDDDTQLYSFKLVLLGDSGVGKTSIAQRFVQQEFHHFQEATIGASFFSRELTLGDDDDDDDNHNDGQRQRQRQRRQRVLLRIWDTAGQERYQSLAPLYFRGAQAAILVYDRTKWHTWEALQKWVRELRQFGNDNAVFVLCGNKCDLLSKEPDLITTTTATITTSSMEEQDSSSPPRLSSPSLSRKSLSTQVLSPLPFLIHVQEFAKQINATHLETSAKDGTNIDQLFRLVAQQVADRNMLIRELEQPRGVDLSLSPSNSRCCF